MSEAAMRKWREIAVQKIRNDLAQNGFVRIEDEVYFKAFILTGTKLFIKNNNHYSIYLDDNPKVEFNKK